MVTHLLVCLLVLFATRNAFAINPVEVLTIPPCSTVSSLIQSCFDKAPNTNADVSNLASFYSTCLCSPSPDQYDNAASSCASIVYSINSQNGDGQDAEYCKKDVFSVPTLPTVGIGAGASSASMSLTGSSQSSTATSSQASPGASTGGTSFQAAASTSVPNSGASMSGSASDSSSTPASTSSSGGALPGVRAPRNMAESIMANLISFLAAMVLV